MTEILLAPAEADVLFAMEKERVDDTQYRYPGQLRSSEIVSPPWSERDNVGEELVT